MRFVGLGMLCALRDCVRCRRREQSKGLVALFTLAAGHVDYLNDDCERYIEAHCRNTQCP